MKQFLKIFAVCALSVAFVAQASELTFDTVDADDNGYISVAEADSYEALKEQFKKLDADEDGRLSEEEFKGFAQ